MMTIDNIINQMKETQCLNCYCDSATFDDTGEAVTLSGSFCYPQLNLQMIEIIAITEALGYYKFHIACNGI